MKRVDPKAYTKKYYLSDCSGYKEYKKTWGKKLEPRLQRIVNEIPLKKGMRVLDIGCGRGELVFWSAIKGADVVIGIDYSKNAIILANEAIKYYPKKIRSKVKFKIRDAKKLKFHDKSFDAILMVEVLEHLYKEEQMEIFKQLLRILKDDGFIFIHTSPNKWFNNFTYKYWCYPISTILVNKNNFFTFSDYGNLVHPSKVRTDSHKIMHVNEPDYFSLKKLFNKFKFNGMIKSTNVTVAKPHLSWKDILFNTIVYFNPLSFFPPFNIFWGNDFYAVLTKR